MQVSRGNCDPVGALAVSQDLEMSIALAAATFGTERCFHVGPVDLVPLALLVVAQALMERVLQRTRFCIDNSRGLLSEYSLLQRPSTGETFRP